MDMFMRSAKLVESMNSILSHISGPRFSVFNATIACTAVWALLKLIRISRRRVRTARLMGPPSPSFTYGVGKTLLESQDPASMYESWAKEYGPVFQVPSTLGKRRIILYDPKAIAHFYAREGWSYDRSVTAKKAIAQLLGKGLFWAGRESHRRQRKALTPAFSIAAIRKLSPIFYDSAHKAKGAWNALIESSGESSMVIDVQSWMNHISLDTMGLAGFSHNFGALEGKEATITTVFDSFSASPASAINAGLILLSQVFPILSQIPTPRGNLLKKMNAAMEEISNALRVRTRKELEMGIVGEEEKSIIGQLIKSEASDTELYLSKDEVISQMKVLLIAGYETTAVSLTWALIELSRNPDAQTRLRNELLEHGPDPTYDQLANGLPYLDAVVHEILRIHAPVFEIPRVAIDDDVIPLSQPILTQSGELIESLPIAKGTPVTIPMASINRSTTFWGEDAKDFVPSRWLEDDDGENGIPDKAKKVQGHRHLLTFSDGPRMCLGKNFAVAEFKAILTVLVKHFVFELRDGPETKIEMGRGFLPRPRMADETGCKLPLRVKPFVG